MCFFFCSFRKYPLSFFDMQAEVNENRLTIMKGNIQNLPKKFTTDDIAFLKALGITPYSILNFHFESRRIGFFVYIFAYALCRFNRVFHVYVVVKNFI